MDQFSLMDNPYDSTEPKAADMVEMEKRKKEIEDAKKEVEAQTNAPVDDKNLVGAGEMYGGGMAVAATGRDPASVPPAELKAANPVTPPEKKMENAKNDSQEDLSNQKKIAMAIIGLAPALLGYAVGGYKGGAVGGQAGAEAVGGMIKSQDEKDKDARKLAAEEKMLEKKGAITKDIAVTTAEIKGQEQRQTNKEKPPKPTPKLTDGLTKEQVKLLNDHVNSFNKETKPISDSVDRFGVLQDDLNNNNMDIGKIRFLLTQLNGEGKRISIQEIKSYGGLPDIMNKAKQALDQSLNSEITPENKDYIWQLTEIFKKHAKSQLEMMADQRAGQIENTLGIPKEKAKRAFNISPFSEALAPKETYKVAPETTPSNNGPPAGMSPDKAKQWQELDAREKEILNKRKVNK